MRAQWETERPRGSGTTGAEKLGQLLFTKPFQGARSYWKHMRQQHSVLQFSLSLVLLPDLKYFGMRYALSRFNSCTYFYTFFNGSEQHMLLHVLEVDIPENCISNVPPPPVTQNTGQFWQTCLTLVSQTTIQLTHIFMLAYTLLLLGFSLTMHNSISCLCTIKLNLTKIPDATFPCIYTCGHLCWLQISAF